MFTNSPSNPTGAVFPAGLVAELVELARRHDFFLISDEVYDEMILDRGLGHTAAARFDEDGRVISVYSFSKVYAMTGWRLGYCVASPALADLLRKLQEPEVSCPSVISQKAAEAALRGPKAVVDEMRDAYRERRDRAWETIESRGMRAFQDAGHLLHARGRLGSRHELDGLHAAAPRRGRRRRGAGRASSGRPARVSVRDLARARIAGRPGRGLARISDMVDALAARPV